MIAARSGDIAVNARGSAYPRHPISSAKAGTMTTSGTISTDGNTLSNQPGRGFPKHDRDHVDREEGGDGDEEHEVPARIRRPHRQLAQKATDRAIALSPSQPDRDERRRQREGEREDVSWAPVPITATAAIARDHKREAHVPRGAHDRVMDRSGRVPLRAHCGCRCHRGNPSPPSQPAS